MDGDNRASGSRDTPNLGREGNAETEAMESGDTIDNANAEEEEGYEEHLFVTPGKRILDEEKQGVLFEILKCAVCLEIPKGKANLRVHTCEKGHHFCAHCHRKLRKCAICRGRLFRGRNFVVEELITKLGPVLGISKCKIPFPDPTPEVSPGVFPCLHQCTAHLPGCMMLPHIRTHHKEHLVENVRTNPFRGRFDWSFNINLTPDMAFSLSAQISDMGLFTVVILFKGNDLIGYIQALGDDNFANLFKYQLTASIAAQSDSCKAFSTSNCSVQSGSMTPDKIINSGHYLKINGASLQELIKEKDTVQILFSIWKANDKKVDREFQFQTLPPEVPLIFISDRKMKRNRNRNLRKKALKARLRLNGPKNEELVKRMGALRIERMESGL